MDCVSVPRSNGMDLVIKLFNSSNAFLKISYNCVSLTPAAVCDDVYELMEIGLLSSYLLF